MQFLKRLRRVTEQELDCFTAGRELPAGIKKLEQVAKPIGGQGTGRSQTRFCILDHAARRESWARTTSLDARRVRRRGATVAETTWQFWWQIHGSTSAGRGAARN
jgi:hypothetical protein